MPARRATSRKVSWCSLGEHEATTSPSSCLLSDIVDDLLLRGVGAGEHGSAGDGHTRLVNDRGQDPVHVDVVGDVAPAAGRRRRRSFARSRRHLARSTRRTEAADGGSFRCSRCAAA